MKKLFIIVTICIFGIISFNLDARVKDTVHNLDGANGVVVPNQEICRPCHTAHNANTETGYLWNHELSNAEWVLHEGADASSVLSSSSRLCLSCHDGTVALDSYGGLNGFNFISGIENLGTDLTNSHPIGVTYPTSSRYNQPDVNGHIVDPVETPPGSYAKLEENRVQCSSCHYAHGSKSPFGKFLRVDNTGSMLCQTCHKN